MDIESAFPSKYLKAADLQGRTPTVTIARVVMEEVGKDKDQRPCIYFQGKDKGVVLNKTNSTNISAAYGRDTDAWPGKAVVLFTAWVDMNGQSVEAIRIRPATPQQPQYQPAPAPVQPQQAPRFDNPPPPTEAPQAPFPGDDIPF